MDGLELTGYLKPKERVGFKYLNTFKGPLGYFADMNNNLQNLIYIGTKEEGADHIIQQFTSSEESFYIIQLPQRDNFYNTFYIEYPQIIGVNYFRMISEKEEIGILPMKLEDFQFLTFEVIPVGGEIEVSIFNCDHYPTCSPLDGNTTIVSDYETFSYTFRKDEWYNEISPMSKNQIMLIISCKSKINEEKEYCELVTNMRTDKNIITNHIANQELPVTRYIKEGDENKYKIKEEHEIYMNVEILSGKVEITYNGEKKFAMGSQKKLFVIPESKETDLKIKASKDSVYRIFDYYNMRKNNSLIIGSNYLFESKDKMTLKPYGYIEEYIGYGDYYLGIYPNSKCKFEVKSFSNSEKNNGTKLNGQYGFYQDIFKGLDTSYDITKLQESKSSCRFYTSAYRLDDKNGISLEDNSTQRFLFKNNSKFTFSYAYAQKEEKLDIYFKLLNNGNYNENYTENNTEKYTESNGSYTVKIFLNNKEYEYDESNIITSNRTIELNYSSIEQECESFNPICTILISVESNENEESILSIGINNDRENTDDEGNEEGEEEPAKKSDDDDDNKVLIIVLCSVGAIIIVGIIIGVILCKTKSENKNLAETVNKISFQDEDGRDNLLG